MARPNNLMPLIAQVACGDRPWLDVYGDDYPTPDGTGVRDYLHVMDLAEGHGAALAALNTGIDEPNAPAANLLTVNLGTGRGYSVLEMIATFAAVSGRAVPYRIAPRRPGEEQRFSIVAIGQRHRVSYRSKLSLMLSSHCPNPT